MLRTFQILLFKIIEKEKKMNKIKDLVLEVIESLPSIIWYAGAFFVGFIIGAW